MFGDNEVAVAKKMRAAYRNGLKPMLCVGENAQERAEGKTSRKISMQLKSALKGITPDEAEVLVVAYEPLWALQISRVRFVFYMAAALMLKMPQILQSAVSTEFL